MRFRVKIFLTVLIVILSSYQVLDAQAIRILPMGNSITFDFNSGDITNPRDDGVRISYRYKLYQMLKAEGFDFDYVGSEDAGNNYFQNSDYDDNGGFPGVETWELASLIQTGYNGYSHQYVSPGPYLSYYPADIILLHIGTNNLTTSADDVEDVLNTIRFYDNDVYILVARIINRKIYHSSTNTFNNNVELMVSSRGDDRIKMVNMESGASINYSTDMYDNLHPKQSGYDKMGIKWFDAITELNRRPVISSIPSQQTNKGESFQNLNLDSYVTDIEDPDFVLAWTYEQESGSQLLVSIDANRNLHVTPAPDYSGSEMISLKVTDSGNGAFPLSDSVEVNFVVDHVNSAPEITSQPITIVEQGALYSYTIVADDEDGDPLIYSAKDIPQWLTFNANTHLLSGIPEHINVGFHNVNLEVTDGMENIEQEFQIQVIDTNDPPEMTSPSVFELEQDIFGTFYITANDLDGDQITISILSKPNWLNYTASVHSLSGLPKNDDVGNYIVNISFSDGKVVVYENLTVVVKNINDFPVITSTPPISIGIGQSYIYRLTATDIDPEDVLVLSPLQLPDWLTFTNSSVDALIYGTPSKSDQGTNLVILQVNDGYDEVIQAFNISVSDPNGINEIPAAVNQVFPIPTSQTIHFDLVESGDAEIQIIDMHGRVLLATSIYNSGFVELDISHFDIGIYVYQVSLNGKLSVGKFLKY
jgi:putative Ig domain-containing protein/type IX secretion system substrate protein/Big-like domain-containing protein